MTKRTGLETAAVHAGTILPRIGGAACAPIFQSTVFEYDGQSGGDYHAIPYPRLNNLPNYQVLSGKLAALEATEDAQVFSSGMAAITTSLLAVLGKGGHLLAQNCLYGGTQTFLSECLENMGASFDLIDGNDPRTWEAQLRPNTRAIYVESITNPLVEVADHRAVAAFASKHGLVAIIDNTFATPVNFRPAELGYDLVVHSATKYLNGHSDLVAGALAGRKEWVEKVRHLQSHLGGCMDPHACFLLERGLKTLVLRVRHQNESALAIARHLAQAPGIRKVNYPGLPGHPAHARARDLFDDKGGFGGMLSFELEGGTEAAQQLFDRVEIPIVGASLGGVETLLTRPAVTSHVGMSAAERRRAGIADGLVRMSVGIETTADLIADLDRALDSARLQTAGAPL